jgi:hypothetical protein
MNLAVGFVKAFFFLFLFFFILLNLYAACDTKKEAFFYFEQMLKKEKSFTHSKCFKKSLWGLQTECEATQTTSLFMGFMYFTCMCLGVVFTCHCRGGSIFELCCEGNGST